MNDNVENLALTGSAAINGTGNALNNILIGNGNENRLFGLGGNGTLTGGASNDLLDGGVGNDILTSGTGADTFVLNQPGQGIDQIKDFSVTEDVLQVSASVFGGGLVAGQFITADQLRIGGGISMANTADQRFINNTSTGGLFFDADGSQSVFNAMQIATFTSKPAIRVGQTHEKIG